MDITRQQLDSLFTGFKTSLRAGMGLATLPLEKFAMIETSTNSLEEYDWLTLLAKFREWVGPRQIGNFRSDLMRIINRDFELTVAVKGNDIDDDKTGHYGTRFQAMGLESVEFWARLGIDALIANGAWIDGKAFFATDRTFGSSAIVNKTTGVLSATSYAAARLAMMSYCGHTGEPLGIVPDTLVVGPSNEAAGKKILENDKITVTVETGESTYVAPVAEANPSYRTAELLVHPSLVGANAGKWYLMKTKGVAKPVVVQKRKVGNLVRWDDERDECVKTHNRCDYGMHHRGEAALTLPPLAYAGIPS